MMLQAQWTNEEGRLLAGGLTHWLGGQPRATPQQQGLIQSVARRIGISAEEIPKVDNVSFEQLSDASQTEAMRLLLVLSCLGESLSKDQVGELNRLNVRLHRPTPWPKILAAAQAGHGRWATLLLAQHVPDARALMRKVWKDEGAVGLIRAFRSAQGKGPTNPLLAARYGALGELPEGTLGHAFFNHLRSRNLSLPGEQGGLPEPALHHDLMHVVCGCDTDARGEGRLAAIYAGMTTRHAVAGADPFTFIMVALMTFQLGYKIGPSFVVPEKGVIDPAEMMALIQVGLSIPFCAMTEWGFQQDFAKPLAEVRARFGFGVSGALAA